MRHTGVFVQHTQLSYNKHKPKMIWLRDVLTASFPNFMVLLLQKPLYKRLCRSSRCSVCPSARPRICPWVRRFSKPAISKEFMFIQVHSIKFGWVSALVLLIYTKITRIEQNVQWMGRQCRQNR